MTKMLILMLMFVERFARAMLSLEFVCEARGSRGFCSGFTFLGIRLKRCVYIQAYNYVVSKKVRILMNKHGFFRF